MGFLSEVSLRRRTLAPWTVASAGGAPLVRGQRDANHRRAHAIFENALHRDKQNPDLRIVDDRFGDTRLWLGWTEK